MQASRFELPIAFRVSAIFLLAGILTACNQGSGQNSDQGSSQTANSSTTDSVEFSASRYTVSQSGGSVTITVDRSLTSGTASVGYSTGDGTAVNGTDYTATSGTLSWSDGDNSPKTFTVDVSDATPFSGAKTFSISLADASGASIGTPYTATVTITGSDTSTAWVYYNGVFNWGGDYSFEATPNYSDTSGDPEEGPYDIAVTVTGQWGGFQPYAGGTVPLWDFDDTGYNYLVVDLKPTVANQVWHIQFLAVGDVAIGSPLSVTDYGPTPQVGTWATYKIPLSDLGVLNTGIYKFFIQDETGLSKNLFYVDNLGFSVN